MTMLEAMEARPMSALTDDTTALPAATPDYERIEQALTYVADHFQDQPDLATIAEQVGLSEFHFQRMFSRWVGISPKKFLQVLSLEAAKRSLTSSNSVLDASFDAGLSGPGRLHDLFVSLEAMTPGEFKAMGAGLVVRWGWHASPFGECLAMSTDRGLCGLAFLDQRGKEKCLSDMAARFPNASLAKDNDETGRYVRAVFSAPSDRSRLLEAPLKLFVKGTPFQVQVWRALLNVPEGSLTTYGQVAEAIGMPRRAARAVGTAVGANPISWLIPCHRVIRETGALGGYHWGLGRKLAMLGWEASCGEQTAQIERAG